MKRHRRKMRALRGRYGWSRRHGNRGHSWLSESAITLPAGNGLVDVVLVDSKGTILRSLARKISRGEANKIIMRRHGG